MPWNSCKIQHKKNRVVKMAVEEFLRKIEELKKEIGLAGFYIPHLCDKMYGWINTSKPTKKQVMIELIRYYHQYKNLKINIVSRNSVNDELLRKYI